MNRYFALTLFLLLLGCSNQGDKSLSKDISHQLAATDRQAIDFSKMAGPEWSRVCFFGPYSNNSSAILGFPWEVQEETDVLASDRHNVIVFATEKTVVTFVENSRANGDFWKLSRKCFPRTKSLFIKNQRTKDWESHESPPKA